jgi:predicted naringenin-chalcone synthase
MNFTILGLGTAVPVVAVDQVDALRLAEALCVRTDEQATWLPTMYRNTGIERRNSVLGGEIVQDVIENTRVSGSVFLPSGEPTDAGPTTTQRMKVYVEHAGPLAAEAAGIAIGRSGIGAKDLTHLITVSCTGFHSPGVDFELIKVLGLPSTIQRTHVGFMGCHGALNGLRVARAFAGADRDARILLCATELCTLHYYYGWNPQKMIVNAIFGDGAAALVGGAVPATKSTWQVLASASHVFPGTTDAMSWSIGDHGFAMTLSKQVPSLIAENLGRWITSWLAEYGLDPNVIASWAIHPSGPRILDATEQALNLKREATEHSRAVFSEHGNMSSPTVLFVLDRLHRSNAPGPCVALAFGPGLTVEAALLGRSA